MNKTKILVLTNFTVQQRQELIDTFSTCTFTFMAPKNATQEIIDHHHIIIGNPKKDIVLHSKNLHLLQLQSASSDAYVQPGILQPHTTLANASGSYGKAIAEHTIGMMLALNKNFKYYIKNMEQGHWQSHPSGKEIYHSTVMIVGLGDLGYQLAARLKAFDCHIIGVKRTHSPLPKNIDELYTIDALDTLLPKVDYCILCLPHSPQTTHILTKERLLTMKKDAMIINVGRGSAIDSHVLYEVLSLPHLYGAALDVVDQEPLDPTHPLWTLDNVLITPHASGGFVWPSVGEYFFVLVTRNIQHYLNNEEIENSVDFTTGYRKVNTAF